MKANFKYYILAAVLLPLLSCESSKELQKVPLSDTPVKLNLSRVQGLASGADYYLMFWNADMNNITSPWFHSLAASASESPNEGEVDFYNWEKNDYRVTKDGEIYRYPVDDSPVYALGWYPGKSLTSSDDYRTLTLADSGDAGLLDVCTTQIESGSYSSPFTSSEENQLEYRHTQVKLNFNVRQTEDVKGRVVEFRVFIPAACVADKWTLDGKEGYRAVNVPGGKEMVFSSRGMWSYPDRVHDLQYTTVTNDGIRDVYVLTSKTDCYILPPSEGFASMFSGNEGEQKFISFDVYAAVAVSSEDVQMQERIMQGNVSVGLTDENGNPWTADISAGDAFTVSIIFKQDKLQLYAQKSKWVEGAWLNIPLNPL